MLCPHYLPNIDSDRLGAIAYHTGTLVDAGYRDRGHPPPFPLVGYEPSNSRGSIDADP